MSQTLLGCEIDLLDLPSFFTFFARISLSFSCSQLEQVVSSKMIPLVEIKTYWKCILSMPTTCANLYLIIQDLIWFSWALLLSKLCSQLLNVPTKIKYSKRLSQCGYHYYILLNESKSVKLEEMQSFESTSNSYLKKTILYTTTMNSSSCGILTKQNILNYTHFVFVQTFV